MSEGYKVACRERNPARGWYILAVQAFFVVLGLLGMCCLVRCEAEFQRIYIANSILRRVQMQVPSTKAEVYPLSYP